MTTETRTAARSQAAGSSSTRSAGGGAAARGPSLTDLERRASASARERPYGDDALIVCDRLVRIFSTDGVEVQALQGLDLLVREGELTAIVGASGSGKSTLLNILAGLDTPSAGSATVAGYDLLTMNAASRLRYRRETVGFIWQRTSRNLLPYLTAAQNVALPMKLRGGRSGPRGGRAKTRRALELLDLLGMADSHDRRPAQLSGGEQQRVAIAVALANSPSVILADEPTGELDTATAEEVFAALRRANSELGTTILVVTHDDGVSTQVSRTVSIRDGRTSTETLRGPEPGTEDGGSMTSREYTTIDRSGRLQLPPEFTEPLAIRDRVLLELRPDHIEVRPGDDAAQAETGTGDAEAPEEDPGPTG
ncbi:ATP-binding cassette domain-containing protein [Streptomyces sp. NBC_01775]|uniref:ATP-binding cassette domain-containing protein n=1 Tax=Streptomyces sp. NBC_01775 TaxID=2975939 RepID=UPI002DDAF61B|nr:ATP-binding cassette domain-containing protein [Streptomyces sp. NBC_01775]WSB79143.1 ATP-binding cassette domain-containing protein [Streptomyces sp. NBC_01775]